MARHWTSVPPEDTLALVLPHVDVVGPLNEDGTPCPWPWGNPVATAPVESLSGFHCPHCGVEWVPGFPHPDYREDPLVAIGDAVSD